jgi:hypothetical protein
MSRVSRNSQAALLTQAKACGCPVKFARYLVSEYSGLVGECKSKSVSGVNQTVHRRIGRMISSGTVRLKKLRLPGLEQTERKAERQSEGATNALVIKQKLCRREDI